MDKVGARPIPAPTTLHDGLDRLQFHLPKSLKTGCGVAGVTSESVASRILPGGEEDGASVEDGLRRRLGMHKV